MANVRWRFAYDPVLAVYYDIKHTDVPTSECSICPAVVELQHQQAVSRLGSTGIAWHGNRYHCHDFIRFKAEPQAERLPGPCRLGQIQSISVSRNGADATFKVKLVGRIATLSILPLTQEKEEVSL